MAGGHNGPNRFKIFGTMLAINTRVSGGNKLETDYFRGDEIEPHFKSPFEAERQICLPFGRHIGWTKEK